MAFDDAVPPGPDRTGDRPRRRWALLAVVAPVVAVAVLLGARAAGGGALDVDAARAAVDDVLLRESATRDPGDGGWTFSGGADPERSLHGSSGVPAPGSHALTVVCASEHGAPVRLTVRVAGAAVVEREPLPCSDARRPGDEPVATTVPVGDLNAGWGFWVSADTRAVLALLVSPGGPGTGTG